MKPQRILPADVYDALELSALAFGGIAPFYLFDEDGNPGCYEGHLLSAGVITRDCRFATHFGIHVCVNDEAVVNVLGRKVTGSVEPESLPRIAFERWCKELNVVRGE